MDDYKEIVSSDHIGQLHMQTHGIMLAFIRPVQAQARTNPNMERGNRCEVSPLEQEPLAFDSC